jgi:hypothetical protein
MKRQFVFQSFKIILNTYEKNQSTNPITLKKHILLIYHQMGAFFTEILDALCERLQNYLKFQKQQTMDKKIIMIHH